MPMFDSNYGAAETDPRCAALLAARKAALKSMWKSPVGSANRRAFEKKANEYGKKYRECKRGGASGEQAGGGAAKVIADVQKAARAAGKPAASFDPSTPATIPAPVTPAGPPVAALVIGGVAVLALLGVALARGGKAAPATFTAKRSTVRRRRVL